MHSETPRSPLLTGALREEAEARVRELARALARPHDDWILARRSSPTGLRSVSLALGRCGTVCFDLWMGRTGRDDTAIERAVATLEHSISLLPSLTMDLSVLCGFPSVAWTTEHVLRALDQHPDAEEDINADIDATLLDALRDPLIPTAYDLIDGLAGLGVYALERRGRSTALALMHAILDRLESTACEQTVGLAWPSGQSTRSAQGKDGPTDDTYFNLGLSHGVPGVIACLARLHQVEEIRERVTPLLQGGVAWLCAQRPAGDPGNRGMYPDFVAADVETEPARLAWCYGDPGVSVSIVSAGRALGRADLVDFGLEVAHAAAARDVTTSSVVDDGICHGTAGLVHVFHRLYRATGDVGCREAALAWLGRLLRRKDEVPNIAGFSTLCFEREHAGEIIEDPAWLTGAAGVGLVLLSALTDPGDPMPTWDRPLLLDLDR